MENNQTLSRIAFLESQVDMLESELSHLNELLLQCGFSEGIMTLKMSVEELLAESPGLYPKKATGLDSL